MVSFLTRQEFRDIYSKVPRLCVDIIIRQAGKILLSKRKIDPYKGFWHIPGGTVYFGETLEQAAKRVAKDELNLEVSVKSLISYLEFSDEYKGGWHGWPISLQFEVEIISGEIKSDYQASKIQFFDKIPQNTVETQKKFLSEKLNFQVASNIF